MRDVFVVYAKRTAVGKFLGSLSNIPAHDLTSELIKDAINSYNIDPNVIDEVILGQVLTSAQGQNPARQAALNSGLNIKTPAYIVNQVCGSGLKAIALAYDSIKLGDNDLVIAGGQENMSLSPHALYLRNGNKFGDTPLSDLVLRDGLSDAFSNDLMGITAENIATKYNISRDEQDEFALNSQMKAANATNEGFFKNEILPIKIKNKKSETSFEQDEFIRANTSLEDLNKLKPAFKKDGTVTAGNSSGMNDGSSILMLASEDAIKKYNLTPLVRIISHASAGVEPNIMGIAPTEAVKKLLYKTSLSINDLDLIESNEAFSAQAIAVNKILNWDVNKVNISGGSISIGHPIGASGARISVTLINNMLRLNAKKALSTLCIGGGMGIAMCFEKL